MQPERPVEFCFSSMKKSSSSNNINLAFFRKASSRMVSDLKGISYLYVWVVLNSAI